MFYFHVFLTINTLILIISSLRKFEIWTVQSLLLRFGISFRLRNFFKTIILLVRVKHIILYFIFALPFFLFSAFTFTFTAKITFIHIIMLVAKFLTLIDFFMPIRKLHVTLFTIELLIMFTA